MKAPIPKLPNAAKRGPRVRKTLVHVGDVVIFLSDNLGASERDALGRTTGEVFGIGDSGVVAFGHPNRALDDWYYVEVPSKARPGEKLYVGVTDRIAIRRRKLEDLVWTETHRDFRGRRPDGVRCVLHLNPKTQETASWPLEAFSDRQLLDKLPGSKRAAITEN